MGAHRCVSPEYPQYPKSEYRVFASGLPAGGGAVALVRAVLPDARSLGFVCLVCLIVSLLCLFVCLFVCGGPVRSGRARAGTSPARSEGPLGVLWVLTHGARRASAGWLQAHSDTQSTRTAHAGTPARAHFFWGSSFNDGTTQTALDPLGRRSRISP